MNPATMWRAVDAPIQQVRNAKRPWRADIPRISSGRRVIACVCIGIFSMVLTSPTSIARARSNFSSRAQHSTGQRRLSRGQFGGESTTSAQAEDSLYTVGVTNNSLWYAMNTHFSRSGLGLMLLYWFIVGWAITDALICEGLWCWATAIWPGLPWIMVWVDIQSSRFTDSLPHGLYMVLWIGAFATSYAINSAIVYGLGSVLGRAVGPISDELPRRDDDSAHRL